MHLRLLPLCLVAVFASSLTRANELQPTPVFEDQFEGREMLGDLYRTGRGHGKGWTIKDGKLFGEQVREDHGATLRWQMDFADLDLEFDFVFNGGKRFNVVIDDTKEKSVHAGHICRVSLSRRQLALQDDKVGAMNLEVRELRKKEQLPKAQQTELDELLARTSAKAKLELKEGQRYRLRVRIQGETMEVFLDGKRQASLTSPGLAHPTKSQLGFTVIGSRFAFDNIESYDTARKAD